MSAMLAEVAGATPASEVCPTIPGQPTPRARGRIPAGQRRGGGEIALLQWIAPWPRPRLWAQRPAGRRAKHPVPRSGRRQNPAKR